MKCQDCGAYVHVKHAHECPMCGAPLKDEVKALAKKTHRYPKKGALILGLVAAAIVVGGVYAMWWNDTHYSWVHEHDSEIVDKTHTITRHCSYRDDDGICYGYYNVHHYRLVLEDGHRLPVEKAEYDSAVFGTNRTYGHTHYDWKPGQEDTPLPAWIWIAPLMAIGLSALFAVAWMQRKRSKEFEEWLESGDLEMD